MILEANPKVLELSCKYKVFRHIGNLKILEEIRRKLIWSINLPRICNKEVNQKYYDKKGKKYNLE